MCPTEASPFLAIVVGWNLISTTVHYVHNFIAAQHYPPVEPFVPGPLAYRVGITVFWPLLTAVGVWAFMRYRAGTTRGVPAALLAYSLLGFTTIFHFLGGVPHIPTVFFVSIFTDFFGGVFLIMIAAWMIRVHRSSAANPRRNIALTVIRNAETRP